MKNYSYITLLSDDSFIYGIILLQKSLKDVNSKYPLEVIVTSNVSPVILNALEQLKLKYRIINPIINDNMIQYNRQINVVFSRNWALALTKFEIFGLTEFDKIIFLDADIMIRKNIDHLFECPHLTAALDGEYFNIWPDRPHFNAGLIVIEPNKEESEKLKTFASEAITKWDKDECIADLEILNMYYSDWVDKPELHLNKYYNVFAPYIEDEYVEDIKENAYFIHFIGRKPWRAFNKPINETYSEELYDLAHNTILKLVHNIDWNKAKQCVKLAVYGICKDEINNIDKYVKCFNKANYLCILDTGSTDGTWEYLENACKEYSNLIIKLKKINPWRYDEARNESLKLVPKDTTMLFMVDLDEIIKEDNWVATIKDCWEPLFSRGAYVYNRRVDPISDAVVQLFIEYRIHNNLWHYEGIVHELLHDIGGRREFFSDECIKIPITVWHYPTNPNREVYIELCERGVEELPDNWIMHLLLAAEYEVHEKWDKAITEYRKIITELDKLSDVEVGRCYSSLGRILGITNSKDEALRVLKKCRTIIPTYGDGYFLAAEIEYNLKHYKEAYELCKNGLEKSGPNQWCTIVSIDGYYPYLLMGLSQYFLGNKIEAMGYIAIAHAKNNNLETNDIFVGLMNEITNGR